VLIAFKLAQPRLVIAEAEPIDRGAPVPTLSARVERSSVPVAVLVAALAAWVYYHFGVKRPGSTYEWVADFSRAGSTTWTWWTT
jgi:hypothetical protein